MQSCDMRSIHQSLQGIRDETTYFYNRITSGMVYIDPFYWFKESLFSPISGNRRRVKSRSFFFWSHMVRTALKTSETTFLPLHFRWPCSCFRIELEASCARCTASCTGSCVADLTLVLFWFKAVPLSGQEIFRCLACRSLFQHQILAYLGLPFRLCNLFMNFIVISWINWINTLNHSWFNLLIHSFYQ